MSEDQKIAFKENDQQWITSMESREDGQKYRALSDLILTGSGTVLTDNPYLNVRNKELINLILMHIINCAFCKIVLFC